MQPYIRIAISSLLLATLLAPPARASDGGGNEPVTGSKSRTKRGDCNGLNDLKFKLAAAESNLESARSNLSNAISERDDAKRMKRARSTIEIVEQSVVDYTARLAKARAARKAAKDRYDQARRACL